MPATATVAPATASSGAGRKPSRRYPFSEKFFNESIKDAINDSVFSPVSLGERHDVRLKPKFDTACWSYQPPHKIYIGTELFEKRIVKAGLTEVQQAKYIANHYHHELGHALYTERDMRKIRAALKRIDAPFPLYNLFEDAYMENRYRNEAKYRFAWYELEDPDFSPRPESLLFSLIQAEGDVVMVAKAISAWSATPPSPEDGAAFGPLATLFAPSQDETRELLLEKLPRVLDYYRRMTAVTQSMQLIPLLKLWLDEFGRPPAMPQGGANGGMSDLEISAELMTNPDKQAEFDKDATPVSGAPDDEASNQGRGDQKLEHDSFVAKKGKVLHRKSSAVDMVRATALADSLQKFFEEKARKVPTQVPQTRVSARHFALGRAPFRKKVLLGRGRRKALLVVDCSGSMNGFHIREGRLLVAALSILAQRGFVEGHVVLSGVTETGPSWEAFSLPMPEATIGHIQGYAGAEGLEFALRDNLKYAKDADFVFVYTDGQIVDRPIDKSFFHRHGVYTWGLYAGETSSYLEELLKYFDKAILRRTAEDLVDAMLAQNK